ncbi:hypothetical protein HDU88_008219 [Geranomyces variabilis]|nr:hypothetical protein HDU88_008219 [Geranomyces variabilis]
MLFSISIPSRFVPRSRRRSSAIATDGKDASAIAADGKVGRYIRDIVADLEDHYRAVAEENEETSNMCSSPTTMEIPTIETTDVVTAAPTPDDTRSIRSNATDTTMAHEEERDSFAERRGRSMTHSRTAGSDSSFLAIPSFSGAGGGDGDRSPAAFGSPRSSSRSSARSTRSTRSFLSTFNIARRLSTSISSATADRPTSAPAAPSSAPPAPRSRANGRPRPHSTSSLPNPPPLFNPSTSFDPTPTYTPEPPDEPLDDIFPPVYHSFTEGPDAYQIVAEIPSALPQDQAFQVFVYDDDRELAFAASQAQMGVRLKLPIDADLAGVKATVSGEILTIRIAKMPLAFVATG